MTESTSANAKPAPGASTNVGPLAGAIRVVSGLTLVSRFAGLARDIVTARIVGDGVVGSAFRAAYAFPNFFRRLFGEGALSAAFLPEYTLLNRDQPVVAGQLAAITIRMLLLVTGGLTLLGILVLTALLLLLPEDAERALSLKLMILMLPMMPAVCLTAVLGGMLQAHGKFAIPAAAPVLLNLFQIAAGCLAYFNIIKDTHTAAYVIGISAVVASGAQILWCLHGLHGLVRWSAASDIARAHGKAVLKRFLPAMLGLGTLQLNTMLDMVIAMWPVWVGPMMLGRPLTLDNQSNAILSYTQTLYQFPLGVFGIAVATAIFPLLARTADNADAFIDTLRRGLRLSLFIGLPAAAGLYLVRHDLVHVIFGGGERGFSPAALARSAAVLAGFAPAVWAYSLNHVLTRAFYAQKDTTTPMRVAMSMVALNLVLNLALIWPLREAGLAWATATSAVVQCIILFWLLSKKLELTILDRQTWMGFIRILLSTACMGAIVWAIAGLWKTEANWTTAAIRLAACVVGGGLAFTSFSALLRAPELGWLFTRAPRGQAGGQSGGDSPMTFE